ncbi:MAG TPA: hypothetical protein VFK66_10640 [Oryzihumus sp.]|nr:hypothetical protein [Oryzihumus sp.]
MSDQDRSDVDAQFAEIIAHWAEDDALASAGAGPWPEQEGYGPPPADRAKAPDTGQDTDAPPRPPGTEDRRPGPDDSRPSAPGPSPSGPTPSGPSPAGQANPPTQPAPPPAVPSWGPEPAAQGPRRPEEHSQADPEDHFIPGPTAPLPAGDLQFWGILIGLTGGPLLLLYLILFDRSADSLWLLLAISMTVGGFALLVSRLPRHRDEDDDDDGARL